MAWTQISEDMHCRNPVIVAEFVISRIIRRQTVMSCGRHGNQTTWVWIAVHLSPTPSVSLPASSSFGESYGGDLSLRQPCSRAKWHLVLRRQGRVRLGPRRATEQRQSCADTPGQGRDRHRCLSHSFTSLQSPQLGYHPRSGKHTVERSRPSIRARAHTHTHTHTHTHLVISLQYHSHRR